MSFTNDQDYDTDLEDDSNSFRDNSCIGMYKHVCKHKHVIPVTQYLKYYDKPELSIHYYGLGPKGMQAFIPSLTVR